EVRQDFLVSYTNCPPTLGGQPSAARRVVLPWHRRQAFFLPVPNPTKLNLLIAGLEKRLCSARRAPAASSVEDDLRGLRQFVGALFEACHRNMNRAGDGATVFDLARFTHVHDDEILL